MAETAPHPTQIPLESVMTVVFFKRYEITTDLICCEIEAADTTWFWHEEADGWPALIEHLKALPGFRQDWFAAVSQPPFAESRMVAFSQ